MAIEEGLKYLATGIALGSMFIGAGYAIGQAYRYSEATRHKIAKVRARFALSLLKHGKYDLQKYRDIETLSRTIDALIEPSDPTRSRALKEDLPLAMGD